MIAKNSSVTKCKIITWTKSLMNKLWCWWYGRKIGGLPGKVDKAALEWEMSLVAGKAVNQINSTHYSLPKKCPRVSTFCRNFDSANFLMVPRRADWLWGDEVLPWFMREVKRGNLWLICFQLREDFLNFHPGFHFEYWPRLQVGSFEMWFGMSRESEMKAIFKEAMTSYLQQF